MAKVDLYIFSAIHGLAGKNQLLDWLGIFLAKYALYVLVVGMFVWVVSSREKLRERSRLFLTALGAALASRFIFTEVIRALLPRERPYQFFGFDPLIAEPLLNSSSFPSGHAAFLFALVTTFVAFLPKSSWLYLAALAVGLARIFAGVHWPSDIVAGAILGIAVGLAARPIYRRLSKK